MSIKFKKGFTLVEILASVFIIALLAGITILNFAKPQQEAILTKVKSDWTIIEGKYIEKLVGKWSLDEGSGTVAGDSTDFKNNGTLTDSPTWQAEKDCISGSCLSFNGSSQYVITNSSPGEIVSGRKARSISAWVNPDNIDPGGAVVAINASSGQSFVMLVSTISSTVYLFTDAINTNNNITITGAEIPLASTWSNMVFTFDGVSTWKYYLNGLFIKSGTFATTINTNPNNISIGLKGGSSYWPGSIDEVSIYSEAITIAKVRSDYITGINELLARNVITKNEYNQRLAKLEGNMAKK